MVLAGACCRHVAVLFMLLLQRIYVGEVEMSHFSKNDNGDESLSPFEENHRFATFDVWPCAAVFICDLCNIDKGHKHNR